MADLKYYKTTYESKDTKSVKDMMEQALKACPDKIAYRYKVDKQIIDVTYKEFYNLTLNLGAGLNTSMLHAFEITVLNGLQFILLY